MESGVSPKEYLDEARSTETSVERLQELAKMEWEFVRQAVASNPKTPPSLIEELVPDGNRWQ